MPLTKGQLFKRVRPTRFTATGDIIKITKISNRTIFFIRLQNPSQQLYVTPSMFTIEFTAYHKKLNFKEILCKN